MAKYSNMRAMRALIKASLQAILKSPSSIVFTIAFPLIFILVFGFLGNEGGYRIKIAATPNCDTTNAVFQVLRKVELVKWVKNTDTAAVNKMLRQGDIVATVDIQKRPDSIKPQYKVTMNVASNQGAKARQLQEIIRSVAEMQDPVIRMRQEDLIYIKTNETAVREYKSIDFILPGQLSFSLLATGVFGTAFVFYNLRQTLVLKRFFATPVRREVIVVSEGIARVIFQILGSIIIISIGHYAFGFTLAHGFFTFIQMIAVCALSLLLFMGFGFIISSLAKSEASIPPFANLITLPQFLLAGTFFPIDTFPTWLRPICKALPLTYLNEALRRISFDGATMWDVRIDILILLLWGVVVYAIAGKVFKWE